MKLRLIFIIVLLQFIQNLTFSQIIIPIPMDPIPSDYEHGFLPGGKFPIYKTIDKYNFNGLKIRVELFDDRQKLNLNKINCSNIEITNTSEFNDSKAIYKLKEYVESIFSQSNIKIDSTSDNILQIKFDAFDSRLIGYGYIKVHGLCQMRFKYKGLEYIHCIDIMDGDDHSPLGSFAIVTRRGATRKLASAAIREVIEQFLIDLKQIEK
jgi:hypothetical protein